MEFDLKELKYQRIRRDLTIKEMAKRLGMKSSSYQKRENGKVKISIREFLSILHIFGMEEKDLYLFFKNNVDELQQKIN